MPIKRSAGKAAFDYLNMTILLVVSLLCLFPYIHILAVSLSSSAAVAEGQVSFWPVDFTINSYSFVVSGSQFMKAFGISVQRVLLGVVIYMAITAFTAYPLSKEDRRFRSRTVYVWFFVVTMFVSGGLIPTFLVVRSTGLINSMWALILPGAVQIFNIVILLNFFRNLPKELEECAFLDGGGHLTYFLRIALPLSVPSLMTLTLFTIVYHWNAWFDGLIYINRPDHYPLQTYIQMNVIEPGRRVRDITDLDVLKTVSQNTLRAAEVLVTSIPVLLAYPFIQKYFIAGITLGSVKE
ncbi:carbohydrate ABC transporter permease [Cohnella sp. GCM10020058]|uniref:carbohydrate ABC transporter permease n=1 Tax=Cohnella sp. GCM10020058 TaxID=3317330 RepID=UPI003639E280